MERTRRSLLQSGVGALGTAALAGCLSGFEDTAGESQSGYAAFFTLLDWAKQIGGDVFAFEDPVDVGELGGHGWEPDGNLTAEIARSDVFIYLDTPEHGWAQDIAAQLEADYDVVTIDAISGLENELLPWDSDADEIGSKPGADHDHGPITTEVTHLDIVDPRTGEVVAHFHSNHWHGELPEIPLDGRTVVEVVFEDNEGGTLPLGEDEPFQVVTGVSEGAQEIVEISAHDDEVALTGIEEGRTQLVFELRSDDEVIFDTSEDSIAVEVTEEPEENTDDEFYDPHIYSDPVLSQSIIDTIAEGLAEIDPDNRETYEENATAYNKRLAEIDTKLESLVDRAEHDVGVLAGHESFRYIEARYGFEIHTPIGVSPDEEPSQEAIAESIEIVNDHGIDVILHDSFESSELAETIVANSDATEIEAVSPLEGTTHEWNERGWGWIEHMEEINIPAFEKALGAE